MSRFNIMPRAYRRQLAAQDQAKIARITQDATDNTAPLDHAASAGRLRGIPAIGPNCPGHIRNTDPGGNLLRASQ